MKKSFMSVSMLIVSISMVALFVCSSVANANTKFVYNKSENAETVYTVDASGKYLTPKVKHEFMKSDDGRSSVKVTSRWNAETKSWMPSYQVAVTKEGNNSVMEYAAWNSETQDFTSNPQKAVYTKGLEGEVLSYVSYVWNHVEREWDMSQQLLLENYLAIHVGSVK